MNSSSSVINAPAQPAPDAAQAQRGGAWRMALAMLLSGTIGLFVIESGLRVEAVVLLRCLIGGAALGAWVALRREWVRVSPRDGQWLAAGGVALVVNWVALFHAYAYAGIGVATVVYHVQPFFLVLVSALSGEHIGWRRVGWMALALVGVVLSSGALGEPHAAAEGGSAVQGVLLALVAAALYTLTVVATRRTRQIPAAQTAMLQMSAGAVVLALWSLPWLLGGAALLHRVPLGQTLACALVLGLVHTAVMYVLMYGAIQRLSAEAIAILSFIYPAVALTVDLLWFGMHPDALQWLGIALIALAIGGYRASELRA